MITGVIYVTAGLLTRHFRKNLFPAPPIESGAHSAKSSPDICAARRPTPPRNMPTTSFSAIPIWLVIFVLFPLVIWTGLALSPAFDSAIPATVNLLGGRQSARTLHFFVSDLLVLFLIVHVTMITLAGFWSRMRAMITGRVDN